MNISKYEQRVLHALAQGGRIDFERAANGRVIDVDCYSRDGWRLEDCTLNIFQKLRRKGLIESRAGGAYRISRRGRIAVRPQLDNR
ncbi:MAG: YjhX family toxin [Neomegalonema sp.]|nr:YjhX family toxin [Neomegalonema sp.]